MACSCLLMAASVGVITNAYGIFYTPLSEALGVGRGTAALHTTIGGIVAGFGTPLVVKLLNKVHLRVIVIVGVVCVELSIIMTAFTGSIFVVNVAGFFRGLGCACVYSQLLVIILGNWFRRFYGTVLGIMLSFSGITGAICNPLFSSYVEAHGYQQGYVLMGIIFGVLSIPMLIFGVYKPENMGLTPFGADNMAAEVKAADEKGKEKFKVNFLSSTVIIMTVVGLFCYFNSSYGQHFSGYTESIGKGATLGATMLAVAMVGNIVFKLINGVLIDLIGAIRTTIIMFALSMIGFIIIVLTSNNLMLLVGAFLYSAVYGVCVASVAAVLREIYGPENSGAVYSGITPIISLGSAFALSIIGYAFDFAGSYIPAFIGGIVFSLSSVVLLVILKRRTK